jgi:PEP-CTERM motif
LGCCLGCAPTALADSNGILVSLLLRGDSITMNSILKIAGPCVLLSCISGACLAATTVDFNDLTGPTLGKAGTGGNALGGSVYTGGGLVFTSDSDLQHWGSLDPENADSPFATLYKSEIDPPLVVTLQAGGSFNLLSLQLAEADNTTIGADVTFSYTNNAGTFSQTLTIPGVAGLHSFAINQVGLTSFSLGGVDYQLDNVVYEVAVVPEPHTYGLMALGLFCLAALKQHRSRP